MVRIITILLTLVLIACGTSKKCCAQEQQLDVKKLLKFSTFYAAVNGGTSLSDVKVFSVDNGLSTSTVSTPYDYNFTIGLRKIARFGYENKAQTFYDGTESNYSDAATVGKVKGVEYLFEVDYKRQEGINYMDQHHFIRFSSDDGCPDKLCVNFFALKLEYLQDGFADVEYFEASERYRHRENKNLSWNIGLTHRLAEPYGYNALDEWMLSNGNIHYTYLALQEGYSVDVYSNEYYNPAGEVVATSAEVWEAVVIPQVLSDYTQKKRNELDRIIQHSVVVGFDYYNYTKKNWLHAWGSLMPWHYDDGGEFSYHNYVDGQWYDYSFGLIYGIKQNKNLGYFVEGKYNKYWNREWYDFKLGLNYTIF
tara:strand:+ start:9783 stop:10877 length:1095 start_codon:yes stop_codon:yes gene_type:complete